MARYADGDVRKLYPDHHEQLFLAFLDYLRCFTAKRYILLDVKYNSTHFLTKPWLENMMAPFLFELIERHGLKVVNLHRKHYLRYLLSIRKAWKSRKYVVKIGDTSYFDRIIRLDPSHTLRQCETCRLEDSIIQKRFASYPHYMSCEYSDIFDCLGKASENFLQRISSWLEIANTFTNQSNVQKQASLPLRETIENYDEIVSALNGTEFEYCLEDEPLYREVSRG